MQSLLLGCLLLLCLVSLASTYDLQEWLTNRARLVVNNGARYWWDHGYGVPRGRCSMDLDCQYRLGTQIARSTDFGFTSNPPGYQYPADSSECTGFEVGDGKFDPNAGAECVPGSGLGRAPSFHPPLFLTYVHYLDTRCVEGKCTDFNPSLPGYGRLYCNKDFRFNLGGGSCPGLTKCVIPQFTDPDFFNPPSGDLFWDNPIFFQIAKYLYYSKDPRDVIGSCECTSDSECPDGKVCGSDSRCWCTTLLQCTGHNGGAQLCLSNRDIVSRLSIPSQPAGTIAGQCSCVVGQEDSCSYNGICKSVTEWFPNTINPAYYTVEALRTQTSPSPVAAGRCECYGKTSLFGPTPNANWIYNETVIGAACEYDSYRDHRCSGHGNPICFSSGDSNGIEVFSKNGGGFIGYRCNKDAFPRRGLFTCQCDRGYYPDNNVHNPSVGLCELKLDCPQSLSSVFVNGVCECSGTTYDDGTSVCLEDCAGAKGHNRGLCFYNDKYLTGPASAPYNNDVKCTTPGWRTLYNPYDPEVDHYYASFYGRSLQEASNVRWMRLKTQGSSFCNVPFNEITGKVCGEGRWIGDACNCDQANLNANVRDNQNQLIRVYEPIPYCATVCLPLVAGTADPATPDEYNGLVCGGRKRGLCVSNGMGGQRCSCNNGYKGVACQTAVCPRARGRACGGAGLCDHFSGKCVCTFGFHGLACEFRVNDCAASQSVLSYPLPSAEERDL